MFFFSAMHANLKDPELFKLIDQIRLAPTEGELNLLYEKFINDYINMEDPSDNLDKKEKRAKEKAKKQAMYEIFF